MNGRTTFRLFLAVFLLGSFIFFYERHRTGTDEEREQMRRVFDVEANTVTGLRIRTADYDVSVVLEEGEWRMTAPAGARANAAMIRQILSRLVSMNRGALITPDEMRDRQQTLSDFGLTVPRVQIELSTLGGDRSYHVGNPNPLGDSVYVKDARAQNMMVVSTDLLSILPSDGTLFRDRSLVTCQPQDLTRIDLRSPEGTVRLDHTEAHGWWLKEPVRHPADAKGLADLLEKLLRATIEDFVPDAGHEAPEFGLQAPTHSLRFLTRQTDIPTVINLGNAVVTDPGHVYASLEGLDGVFTVSAGLKVLAEMEASALRDRRVLPLSPDEIASVSLRAGEQSCSLHRGAEGWELRVVGEERVWPADQMRATRFLELWLGAQTEQYLSSTGEVQEVTGAYQVAFELNRDPGELNLAFSVFPSEKRKGRSELLPEGGKERWVVLPENLGRLPADALAYRSRRVLAFDIEEVVRVTRTAQNQTSRVVRASAGAGRWETDMAGQHVDHGQVLRVLNTCRNLHAQHLEKTGEADLAAYGLAAPRFRLSFGLGGEQPANRTLLVGKELASGEVYGMIQGQDLVFTLSREQSTELDASLTTDLPPPAGQENDDALQSTP